MKTTSRIFIGTTIAIAALLLISLQLANFAVDTTLRGWHEGSTGLQVAIAEQKKSGKPIALFFYTDWCQNCKALRENILSSPEFKNYAENLIPVKINPEIGPDERKIADKYGVFGYPTFLIQRPDQRQAIPVSIKRNLTPESFIGYCNRAVDT